jgi:hypothetical protein
VAPCPLVEWTKEAASGLVERRSWEAQRESGLNLLQQSLPSLNLFPEVD